MLRRNQLLPTEEFDFSSVLRRSGAVSSVNSHLGVAGAPDKSIFVESLKGLFFPPLTQGRGIVDLRSGPDDCPAGRQPLFPEETECSQMLQWSLREPSTGYEIAVFLWSSKTKNRTYRTSVCLSVFCV